MLDYHYSPKANVVLSEDAQAGDGFIAMANFPTPKGTIRLAAPTDIEQYARVFFMALRLGDQKGLNKIVVVPPEGDGLAVAIRDRMFKASAG